MDVGWHVWIFLRPDMTEGAHGMDFFEVAADGRIRGVTGFFGSPRSSRRNAAVAATTYGQDALRRPLMQFRSNGMSTSRIERYRP